MKYVVRNGQRWIFGDFAVSLTIHSTFFSLAFRWLFGSNFARSGKKRRERNLSDKLHELDVIDACSRAFAAPM